MRKKSAPILNALQQILSGEIIGTQEEIQAALEKRGFKVNQSKISRLLHQIGAVKVKDTSGSMIYQLPKEPAPPAVSNLSHLVTDFANNEMLIIVHTSPGSASLVARTLDYNEEKLSILGTVAGDDTIIVIPRSTKHTPQVLEKIKKFFA